MHDLVKSLSANGPELDALVSQAAKYIERSRSVATRLGYASDLRDYQSFCSKFSLPYIPGTPGSVALYIAHLASRQSAVSTIKRRLAAITFAHRQAGWAESPASSKKHFVVREVLAGIKRTHGTCQHGAVPLMGDAVGRISSACPPTLLGIRDRALVLLGFSGALRRSELASILEVSDLSFIEEGLYIRLRRAKNDPEQAGRTIAIPLGKYEATCPVRAVRAWLDAAGISGSEGPLFRAVDRHGNVSNEPLSPRSLGKIVARAASRAAIDATGAHVSPHSLRAGMVTQAAINGAEERDIARTTLRRSVAMVRRYVRDADLFRGNASARLGL